MCPVCKCSLLQSASGFSCINGHQYDRAKYNYVNLLLANQKKSKEPGDSKAMINARHTFLQSGAYEILADRLRTLVKSYLNDLSQTSGASASLLTCHSFNLLDAACGEGYYSAYIKEKLEREYPLTISGVDISKFAITKAAKTYKLNSYAVASTYNLTLETHSQDIVLQVFGPSDAKEIARILKPGGLWLEVMPGESHLEELKAFVYEKSLKHEPRTDEIQGFSNAQIHDLAFDVSLPNTDLRHALLTMTPFLYRISDENKQQLLQRLNKVHAHFTLCLRHSQTQAC